MKARFDSLPGFFLSRAEPRKKKSPSTPIEKIALAKEPSQERKNRLGLQLKKSPWPKSRTKKEKIAFHTNRKNHLGRSRAKKEKIALATI